MRRNPATQITARRSYGRRRDLGHRRWRAVVNIRHMITLALVGLSVATDDLHSGQVLVGLAMLWYAVVYAVLTGVAGGGLLALRAWQESQAK